MVTKNIPNNKEYFLFLDGNKHDKISVTTIVVKNGIILDKYKNNIVYVGNYFWRIEVKDQEDSYSVIEVNQETEEVKKHNGTVIKHGFPSPCVFIYKHSLDNDLINVEQYDINGEYIDEYILHQIGDYFFMSKIENKYSILCMKMECGIYNNFYLYNSNNNQNDIFKLTQKIKSLEEALELLRNTKMVTNESNQVININHDDLYMQNKTVSNPTIKRKISQNTTTKLSKTSITKTHIK